MNEYFKCCSLLFFTGIKTGEHSSIYEDGFTIEKINLLSKEFPADLEIVKSESFTNVNEWPKSETHSTSIEEYLSFHYSKKFSEGLRKVIGIFSLPEILEAKHLEEAMLSIRPLDFCIGPDKHGGIYLLGMNIYEEKLILNQPWLGTTISKSIIREIGNQKKITYKLPVMGIAS